MTTTNEVVGRLRTTFRSGKTRDLQWRETQLIALRRMLLERAEDFIEAVAKDLRRPRTEGWMVEVGATRADLDHVLANFRDWARPRNVGTPLALLPARTTVHHEPKGIALIIGPWNYPANLVLSPAVAAIAAGNCVIIKPSELALATSATLARLVPNYLDQDAIQVVEGAAETTQALIAAQPDHIFFTGGAQTAKHIMTAAAQHLIPVSFELGGKSPCIVDEHANFDVAAKRIIWGKGVNAGQTCLAPDYILVPRAREAELTEKLAAAITQFWGDDPQKSPDLGRIINDHHFERLRGLLEMGDVVVGGASDPSERYIAPTLLCNVPDDAPVLTEEIFGPILPIVAVEDLSEAITFIGERPTPLALYLFSNNTAVQQRVIDETRSGDVSINDVVSYFGNSEIPFGGLGASGFGSTHGRAGFDTFSHQRGVLRKTSWLDPWFRYAPYSESKLGWLRRVL